jgi:predicted NAD/FAD-dependent oxidoreductase
VTAPRIAVVGAGPAGLTCARALLDAGLAPRVFEKSRGIGGRVATRRRDGLQFDHGAQALHLDAEDPLLADAAKAGTVARWPAAAGPEGGAPWVGVPTMKEPFRAMADGLDIAFDAEVTAIARAGTGWRLTTPGGAEVFDRVLLAMPAPQILRALSTDEIALRERLSAVRFEPCYVLLVAFDAAPGWPEVMRAPGGPFAFIQREASKPGRPALPDAWVAQATPDWSRAHLATAPPDADRPAAAEALLAALGDVVGAVPPVRAAMGHRWRFARTETALGQPFAETADGTLLAGGDWALGPDLAHARASGRAMAQAIRDRPG